MHDLDVTIIGGGIVGCALAEEATSRGYSTVLLEKESQLARGATSRNSEVSHGGMYYRQGSNKARFCVEGRRLLKDFCTAHGVDYQECGKLIVALDSSEESELERLLNLGQANGVEDLRLVSKKDIGQMEPQIEAQAGLFSPRTGIVDAEGVARAFAKKAQEQGARVMTSAQVTRLEKWRGSWRVTVRGERPHRREGWQHTSRFVINAAGLRADLVAAMAGVDTTARQWKQVLLKGNYFRLSPQHAGRVKHLIYPVPPADGSSLGVHVCLDLQGQIKLGPDIEVARKRVQVQDEPGDGLDYRVDPARKFQFFHSAVKFLPWLQPDDLTPDMAGYRPKLVVQGFRDFELNQEVAELEGLINLVGIDSPGLTSAAALAQEVGKMMAGEK